MHPTFVGIIGKALAGKSTLAKQLEADGWKRVRFAGPVKDMLKAMGLTDAQVDGDEKEIPTPILCGQTPRHALQTLGTEWGRSLIAENVWANLMWQTTARHLAAGHNVVCDDTRFPNELSLVRRLGGIVVRVERESGPKTALSNHESETLLDGEVADITVRNNRLPDDLVREFRRYLSQWTG